MSFIGSGHIGSGFIGRFIEILSEVPIFGFPSTADLDVEESNVAVTTNTSAAEITAQPKTTISMEAVQPSFVTMTPNTSDAELVD